jgi:hypothetical protein
MWRWALSIYASIDFSASVDCCTAVGRMGGRWELLAVLQRTGTSLYSTRSTRGGLCVEWRENYSLA